jgi:regulator of protease activity HflC (stomatin/prohibitin superfamily)
MKRTLVLVAAFVLSACARVDETEYCVKTRYGNVIDSALSPGLTNVATPGVTLECFSLTDQNFPEVSGDDGASAMTMEVATGGGEQPLTINVEVSAVYSFDPTTVYNVFLAKRSERAAEVEVFNSIQEGTRAAFSAWTVNELFGPDRVTLSDSVKFHIQRKLSNRAIIKNVFVKNIKLPSQIEAARIAAAQQEQVLDKARKQFVIDSTEALGKILKAEAEAKSNALRAQSYSSNPKLLDLEIARAWSDGLAKACNGASTCIIGGQALDLLPLRNRQ